MTVLSSMLADLRNMHATLQGLCAPQIHSALGAKIDQFAATPLPDTTMAAHELMMAGLRIMEDIVRTAEGAAGER